MVWVVFEPFRTWSKIKKKKIPFTDLIFRFQSTSHFIIGEVSTSVSEDTVRMISTARFSVGILLLHHYKSDLAHLSDLCSLVIGLYKSER